MKTKFRIIPVMLLGVSLLFSSCNDEEETPVIDTKNIVEVAQDAGSFTLLIEAAQRAGLDGFLSAENDLTVFAPADDAFEALLTSLGVASVNDIPAADLERILAYHVVGASVRSGQLTTGYLPTLASYGQNSLSMYIRVGDKVNLNSDVTVTTADIEASNGIIHVVDKVLLPPTVVDIALANDNFTTLVQAVVKAGLVEALSGEGPFTIFAPTNAAFEELFAQLGVSGIEDLTAGQLVPVLTYHVVPGNVRSGDLSTGPVNTLNEGQALRVDVSQGVQVNQSQVVLADIQGANGVIHVIDRVLLPD